MPMQSSFSFPDLLLPSFGGFGPVNLGMKMAPEPQPSTSGFCTPIYSPVYSPIYSPTKPQPAPLTPLFRPWLDHVTPSKESPEKLSHTPTFVSAPVFRSPPYLFPLDPQGRSLPLISACPELQTISNVQKPAGGDDTRSALENLATSLGKSSSGYRCIYCGKFYSRKYGLKIHLRTHTGYKPLKCKLCQRAFGDPSNLNKHTRLHVEQGSLFKCNQCGKLVLKKQDLDAHIASVHSHQSRFITEFDPVKATPVATIIDTFEEIDVVGD